MIILGDHCVAILCAKMVIWIPLWQSMCTFSVLTLDTSNPQRRHHGWCRVENFSKFVPPDTQKLPVSLSLCSYISFVNYFPNYLSLHYKKLFFVDYLKKIHIFK